MMAIPFGLGQFITTSEQVVGWTINLTGIDTVLNVTIPIQDNEHIQICIEKPSQAYITELKKTHSLKEIKAVPIQLISELTENTEIFKTKTSFDFTSSETQYCMTVYWTKLPSKTTVKIGWNTVYISNSFSGAITPRAHPFLIDEHDDLFYVYLTNNSDVGLAYSDDDGATWTNRQLKATTAGATRTMEITHMRNESMYNVYYVYDDSKDDVRLLNMTDPKTQTPTETADYIADATVSMTESSACAHPTYVSAYSTTDDDIQTRYPGGAQQETHTNANFVVCYPTNFTGDNYDVLIAYEDLTDVRVEIEYGTSTPNSGDINIGATGYLYPAKGFFYKNNLFFPVYNTTSVGVVNSTLPTSWTVTNVITKDEIAAEFGITPSVVKPALTMNDQGTMYLLVYDGAADKLFYKYMNINQGNWSGIINYTGTIIGTYGRFDVAYSDIPLDAHDPIHLAIRNDTGVNTKIQYGSITQWNYNSCDCPGSGSAWVWDLTQNCDITSDCTGITSITCVAGDSGDYIAIKAHVEADSYTCNTDAQVHIYPAGRWEIDG